MKLLRNLLWTVTTSIALASTTHAALPENYQSLASEQKQTLLWQNIEESHSVNPLPKLKENSYKDVFYMLKGLFNLAPSFDYFYDETPEGRIKIIHANGSVAKISFVPASGHPFTGIYQSGAIGIARLSLATTPSDASFIPGMAIKFLIPDNASLNLHVMEQLSGQGNNWNYFAKTFSNKIPHADSWVLTAIEKIFAWTRSPANDLPVDHLAIWDKDGNISESPIAPQRLFFKPSERVANAIDENSREDFRTSLGNITEGALYEVYGIVDDTEYHIGTLMLDSSLLASNYGDKTLFFQHRR